jgi:acyl-CoA thioester hydrolase
VKPPAFLWPVQVYWEDTDAGGVVYYANYLKFLERGRSEWLRSLGVHQEALRVTGQLFVVSHVEASYLRPARLDDALTVSVGVAEARPASLVFAQSIWRGEEELLRARVRAACVDAAQFKPRRIDPDLIQRLTA